MKAMSNDRVILHRGAYVLPVCAPPVEDGAVLERGGIVVSAGRYRDVVSSAPPGVETLDHGDAAVIPALVNAHTHLELTLLEGRIPLPQASFAGWLGEVLARRPSMSPDAQRERFPEGMKRLADAGTILCGDITNGACLDADEDDEERGRAVRASGMSGAGSGTSGPENGTAGSKRQAGPKPERVVFLELLGFNVESIDAALGPGLEASLERLRHRNPPVSMAAHACYSTSGALIAAGKNWCRERGRAFSIHTAEHPYEIEFLMNGTGFCREILESLGRWTPGWVPPRTTPVRYLDGLGVLDRRTLLAHAVHMAEEDWEIVASRGASVCFCPRSNFYTGAGKAAMDQALRRGINAALGTDSLAGNTDLDLLAEAAWVLDHDSHIPPEALLRMVTLGGAKALRLHEHFGSIQAGRRAALLAVSLPASVVRKELEETVIYRGAKGEWQWAN